MKKKLFIADDRSRITLGKKVAPPGTIFTAKTAPDGRILLTPAKFSEWGEVL